MHKLIVRASALVSMRSIAFGISALALVSVPALANPEGGTVVAGEGTITAPAPNEVRVTQSSNTLILNWNTFDIEEDEITRFLQPGALSLAVNRIGSNDPSKILGTLTANGRIILINPNGLLFGDTARINVGSLVATTHDLTNDDIRSGKFHFDISGNPLATVENHAAIVASGGSVAFVAPGVSNSGTIVARLGTVALAGASKFTLDFEGDNLITFPVGAEVISQAIGLDGNPVGALVSNSGSIEGSAVVISARSAGDIVANAINIEGSVIARTARRDGDDIVLGGRGPEIEHTNRTSRVEPEFARISDERRAVDQQESGHGGTIVIDGGSEGHVDIGGVLDASGASGGTIRASGEMVYADGLFIADGIDGSGGSIFLDSSWLSIGGALTASGTSTGGLIDIDAGALSFAGSLHANGRTGAGGNVDITTERKSLEFKGARIDVSGASGGSIRNTAGQQTTTSANYVAVGRSGAGGMIDISASATKLLSPTLDASGFTAGGRIRLGGEYQGGRSLLVDELANARTTVASDGTKLHVDVLGPTGAGGTVIVWSDAETVFLGSIFARPGGRAGVGGFAEISSAELLQYAGHVETGIDDRQGTVLFDPKNINIVDVAVSGIQLQLVLSYNFVPGGIGRGDEFGGSVSLDGLRMAVGAPRDDGSASDGTVDAGAVYLFTFSDENFSGAILQSVLGKGYSGSKNLNVALATDDMFGTSVSLSGNSLVVGAPGDDGNGDSCESCGAAYLFTFADDTFGGIAEVGRLGAGYAGPNSLDLASYLDDGDSFGQAVSLDGARLAVGATGDDGFNTACNPNGSQCGAIYLFNFASADFSDGTVTGRIGFGYTGTKDIDTSVVEPGDNFGHAVSLDDTGLAVGIPSEQTNEVHCGVPCGRVLLFKFDDADFSGGRLAVRIGRDVSGPNDIDLALHTTPFQGGYFGWSVSLDGTRLAVGAPGDQAACDRCGAVFLFDFADTSFGGGSLSGRIAFGAGGATDLPLPDTVERLDFFGTAVALSDRRLVVGAPYDDGASNACANSSLDNQCGAVHFFALTPSGFAGGQYVGAMGVGYGGGNNVNVNALGTQEGDQFGASVALDGLSLVVGASGDDGASTTVVTSADFGAVYFFSFADTDFSGATLEGLAGVGYTGGKNIDLSEHLGLGERFGSAVSLDGNRLTVGAPGDLAFGAVYLFAFEEDGFGAGNLKGILGSGYAPTPALPANLDLADLLQPGDQFGLSVSMDGLRLAVGAPADDGQGFTGFTTAGAVHLFTFGDSSLSSSTHVGSIGLGYTGPSSLDLEQVNTSQGILLFDNRQFGGSVSLDGNHLAVGLPANVSFPSCTGFFPCVRVALFSFEDEGFSSPTLGWTLSHGSLDYSGLGTSVSLDGKLLAVGEPYRCAFGNPSCAGTNIHLLTFDASFASATETGAIGFGVGGGFDGPNEYNIASIRGGEDGFGTALALNQGRLAVGQASWGQGLALGRVALFTLDNSVSPGAVTFDSSPGSDATISRNALVQLLNSGQNVVLQANNDITLSVDLVVNRLFGDGGDLTLQAGRSVLLNGSITSDNGNLLFFANSPDAVSTHRDPGEAKIVMQAGTWMDAGAGHVEFQILGGEGFGGDIALEDISAGSLFALTIAGRDIMLNGEVLIASDGAGGAFLVANNDIFVGGEISAVCGVQCYSAALVLWAGRSILFNAPIYADGMDVTARANIGGVADEYRAPGDAHIKMASGTVIDARCKLGSCFGDVWLSIGSDSAKTNYGTADVTLSTIHAGHILVENLGTSNGNVAVCTRDTSDCGSLTALAGGNAITLASSGGNFLNFGGPQALSAPNGRWLIYGQKPIDTRYDGLVADQIWDEPYTSSTPSGDVPADGNWFAFTLRDTLKLALVSLPRNRNLRPPNAAEFDPVLALIEAQRERYAENLEGSRSVFVEDLNDDILAERAVGRELDPAAVGGKILAYAALAEAVYEFDDQMPNGYKRVWGEEGYRNGLAYAVYKNTEGKVVLAFRGTQGLSARDWRTNFQNARSARSSQQLDALWVAQVVIAQYGAENVTIVGHSLGGLLAQYTGSYSGLDVIAINAAPFGNNALVGPHRSAMLSTGLEEDYVHNCRVLPRGLTCDSLGYRQLGVEYYFDYFKDGDPFFEYPALWFLLNGCPPGFLGGCHSVGLFREYLEEQFGGPAPGLIAQRP